MARPLVPAALSVPATRGMGAGSMQITVLRMDLGKNSGSVVGLDGSGRVILRRRLQRQGVVKLAAGLPTCLVTMEACCGGTSSRPYAAGAGPNGPTNAARIRPAPREGPEERCPGCGGDRRGCDAADASVRLMKSCHWPAPSCA